MGPAVRRTRPQSRITAAPVQDPNYSGPKIGIACSAVQLRAQSPAVGNGIFGCRDRAPKIITKCPNACRDQRPRSKWPEIPAEAPYLASTRERVARGDWVVEAVGHKLATHHPVIETGLRRRAGNGNLRCRDGHAKAGLSPSGDQSRDAQECKKPPFQRNKCEKACGSLSPTTGWWRWYGSNWLPPAQSYRTAPLPPS